MTRTLTAALLAVALLAGAGCTSDAEGQRGDDLSWLADQEEVADAQVMPYDDGEDEFLRVTLVPHLSDDEVGDVVHRIKEHFDPVTDRPSIEVDVDGFVGSVYPALVGSDPDLKRALWLRQDGRATAYGEKYQSTVSSHPVVTAPAADVAALALDYDAAVSYEDDVRRSHSVESADRTTGVQWAASDGMGYLLPADAVQTFADIQQAYPGTTGWVDSDGGTVKASIVLDPDDVDLDDLLADPASYVDPAPFDELELGWGPARGSFGGFAKAFGYARNRAVLDRLVRIPGVTEFEPTSITVSDRASLDAVGSFLRSARTAGAPVAARVRLVREPTLFGGLDQEVFETFLDNPAVDAAYRAVADLDGVTSIALSERSSTGFLTIRPDIDDGQLRATMAALAGLPRWYEETAVRIEVPGDYGSLDQFQLGVLRDGRLRPDAQALPGGPELAKRIEQVWAEVSATT